MRSLALRLTLAFALISIVGVGLAALFVRQQVTSTFDSFISDQRTDDLVSVLADYYAENSTWAGVAEWLRSRGYLVAPGEAAPRRDRGRPSAPIVLADPSGRILVSSDPRRRTPIADAALLAAGAPILVNEVVVGILLPNEQDLVRSQAEERYLRNIDNAMVQAAMIATLIALVLGVILARLIAQPIRELTTAAAQIAAGELGRHVTVRSKDEIGALARQFNRMSSDLQQANMLRRRTTADIAHDLRTPLTVIAGYLEALRDGTLQATPARLTAMHDETQILLRLVADLHTLAQADAGELPLRPSTQHAAELLERALATYRDAAQQAGVELRSAIAPDLPAIVVDGEQIIRMVGNLLGNALNHTPAGGRITLSARNDRDSLLIQIHDTGNGIAAEHLPHIFERFYRADESRRQDNGGSGLGLAIVRSIVTAHGGSVEAASSPGAGSTFSVRLPYTPTADPSGGTAQA